MIIKKKANNILKKVSVIIPCYNHESYIAKAVESVLSQTYKSIEIIIIDNGSTDGSRKVILEYNKHPNIKLILHDKNIYHPVNGGFNVIGDAIKQSNGEFISVLFSDDWYLPEKIEKQIKLFEQSKSSVGVVYCHGYRYFDSTKKKIKWEYQLKSARGYVFKDYLSNGDVVIPIAPLVKRYCYDIIGLENEWTGAEYDYLVMSQYVDFDYVNDYLVVMRDHESNEGKNIFFVYKKLKNYHSKALLNKSAKARGGRLVKKRIAMDYVAFGMDFITMLDMDYGKKSLFYAIKMYPMYLFNFKLLVSLGLLLLPISLSKYLLIKSGKLSYSKTVPLNVLKKT